MQCKVLVNLPFTCSNCKVMSKLELVWVGMDEYGAMRGMMSSESMMDEIFLLRGALF